MAQDPAERERVLALLASQHTFPGPFLFRVVVRPPDRSRIVGLVEGAAGTDRLLHVGERASRHGAYVSLRIRVQVDDPEAVLQVYDALRGIEGVFAVM